MSEYRSVNFADLCRLCAATQGTKLNLFSEAGRKQELAGKIVECLPVRVEENDELPKTICELCVQQVLQISEYRQKCSNTDTMLRGCLGTPKLKNEGRVYIKDEAAKAGPGGSKPATNIVTLKNMKQTLVPLHSQPQQQQQQVHQQQQIQIQQTQQLDPNTMTISSGNDYLSSIVQQVGIKMDDGSEQPQYTYTIQDIQQQKINDQQRIQTYSQVDEFLKPKTDGGKMQYNLVVNNNQLQQITTSSANSSPQVKQIFTTSNNNNSPFVLTTNSGTTLRTQTQQQQKQQQQQQTIQMIQQSPQKQQQQQQQQCMIIKDNSQQVYQIKLEPQMSTADGQTIYQLTPAPQQTFQTITPQHQQNQQQKMVSNHQIQPIQFTTLTNVASNSTKGSPTMITIQDTPGKGQTATQITPVGRIASTTITRKTPLVLKQDGVQGQLKYVTSPMVTSNQSNPIIVQSASSNNGGMTKVTAPTKTTQRAIVLGNKGVKMISAPQQQQQQQQQTVVKTVTMTQPKIIPLQTVNSMHEDTIVMELNDSGGKLENKPTCDVCQKEFKRKEHLVQHMKLHQGVRPFKCDQCDKAFNRKEHLLRHRTSHTGAKSFKCEHCQKMFSRKDNLNKHKRKHTGGGDEEPGPGGKIMKADDGAE